MTLAQNNVYTLPGGVDDYEWYLVADAEIDFRFVELLVPEDAQNGKGGLPFKFALDKDFLHEPAIIKLENSNLPLIKIIGHPQQTDVNKFEFVGELQTSDPNAWIPSEYLSKNRRALRVSTSVSTELNTKYAGVHFGEMYKLQSWVGSFGNKCEFTDKFIRTEIACRKEGRSMPKSTTYSVGGTPVAGAGIGVGYFYAQDFRTKENKVVEKGVFVTKMEAMLLERTQMDLEMNMEFGQIQKTVDHDSKRPIKVPPGWRQLVRDGWYREHNGTLSLGEIYSFISEVFLTRRQFSDRKIKLSGGEPALELLNRVIKAEAAEFTYIDTLFTKKRTDPQGYHENELEYGAQFTKIKMTNGYVLEIQYDPNKDDRQLHPELIPGTNRTREGLCMDIFDFGMTDQKAADAMNSTNITSVKEDGVEEYYTVSNVYDFNTGAINDGGNAKSNNKELGIYRAISGGLCVWDVTRIGRLEFNPFMSPVGSVIV
jgi:hypothetical protein